MKLRALALAALALLLFAGIATAQEDPIDVQTREIAKGLKCPICENLSVADSPSQLAGDMRAIIRTKLQQGESPAQIQAYFVDRYGEEVLLDPPRHGFALLVWALPALIIALGAGILGVALLRWVRSGPGPEPEATDEEVEEYEERIRAGVDRLRYSK